MEFRFRAEVALEGQNCRAAGFSQDTWDQPFDKNVLHKKARSNWAHCHERHATGSQLESQVQAGKGTTYGTVLGCNV